MWLLGLLILAVAGYVVYRIVNDKTDAAFETKVESAVTEVKTEVKSVLDVNKDGKVDLADAVEAGKKVKAGAKKAAGKAKAAAAKVKKPKLKVAK
jgi:hypothetical protein